MQFGIHLEVTHSEVEAPSPYKARAVTQALIEALAALEMALSLKPVETTGVVVAMLAAVLRDSDGDGWDHEALGMAIAGAPQEVVQMLEDARAHVRKKGMEVEYPEGTTVQ